MLDDLAAVDVRGSWYQSLYDAGYNFGYSCTDPFGWGFGGGSWWGSGIGGYWGDPFAGGPCETREQCERRLRQEAEARRRDCRSNIFWDGIAWILSAQYYACRTAMAGGPGAGIAFEVESLPYSLFSICQAYRRCEQDYQRDLSIIPERCFGKPERCQ